MRRIVAATALGIVAVGAVGCGKGRVASCFADGLMDSLFGGDKPEPMPYINNGGAWVPNRAYDPWRGWEDHLKANMRKRGG
jgi:hypothetical protein